MHLNVFFYFRLTTISFYSDCAGTDYPRQLRHHCITKRRLQYFGHLMRREDSLAKTLMLGKCEGKRRRGRQRTRWLDSVTEATKMNLTQLQEAVEDRRA